jgi:hypothetical protein
MDDLPGSASVAMVQVLTTRKVVGLKVRGADKLTGLGSPAEMRNRHDFRKYVFAKHGGDFV